MTKETTPANYTPAQENTIRTFKGTGVDGKLNAADAATIAGMSSMNTSDGKERTARQIIAKISRMSLPYERKVATRKDGSAVESKADLVARIATAAGVSFDGLANAPRGDLVKLADWASRKAA